jgi:hypothetical protein
MLFKVFIISLLRHSYINLENFTRQQVAVESQFSFLGVILSHLRLVMWLRTELQK